MSKTYELFENDNNRIVCNVASGSSPFTFHWFKDSLPLSENQRRKIDVTEDFSILSLKNVTKQDSGSYICQVNNSFGSDSSSTKLHVKGSFGFIWFLCQNVAQWFSFWRFICFSTHIGNILLNKFI